MTEGPYKLPEGWRWVRLGEVCELLIGRTPRKEEYLNENTGTKVLKFRDIMEDGTISWTNHVAGYVKSEFAGRIAEIGDVILTAAAHTPEQIGRKVAYLATIPEEIPKVYFAAELMVLRADKNLLDGRWLTFWLQSEEGYKQIQAHVKEKHLVKTRAKEISLPLPPLDEQRRVVARIEELMARVREAKRLRRQAKEDAERLMQAALAEVFPRPGAEPPTGWRWVRLGEVFDLQQGVSMSPKRRRGSNPQPFLRTRNILWGSVDIASLDQMDFTEDEIERFRLQPGDLLVCEGGDVGRTAIWEAQVPVMLYQNHIHRLRRKDADVEPRFFMYWMRVAYQVFRAYQGTESRTAIPNLSGRRLRDFIAPLPPLDEQRRIVAHLEAVQEKIKALKEAQATTDAKLQRLEQAILDKAFRGEL